MFHKYHYLLIYKHTKFFIKEIPKYKIFFISYLEEFHAFMLIIRFVFLQSYATLSNSNVIIFSFKLIQQLFQWVYIYIYIYPSVHGSVSFSKFQWMSFPFALLVRQFLINLLILHPFFGTSPIKQSGKAFNWKI